MRTGQRRREILRLLFLEGYVGAADFAERFGVNASTIRRDLEALAQEGLLRRAHGGASLVMGAVDIPYAHKSRVEIAEKQAIARFARTLVHDGDAILLDSGSTTHELALRLHDVVDLTVVTNDLRIARVISDFPQVRLLVTGGEQLSSTYSLVGERTVQFVEQMRVDTTFLGADAISAAAGITNTNAVEVPLKRAMIAAAHQVVVLADSTKFGRHALIKVCGLDGLDLVITDDGLAEAELTNLGGRLRRVPVHDETPTEDAVEMT